MNFPLVTIAIAVYNTEKYLSDCMDSVVNQTYQNLEIICVNDCSTDKSLEILEEYASKDSRVKIITNEKNSGLGVTRNVGLDTAHGEYILFMDSDDWLDQTTCEKLFKKADENKADVVFYASYLSGNSNVFMPNKCDLSYLQEDSERLWLIKNSRQSTWSKFWSVSFLKEHDIRFPDLRRAQDMLPHWLACIYAKYVGCLNEGLYFYRSNPYQVSKSDGSALLNCPIVFNSLENELKKRGKFEAFMSEFYRRKFLDSGIMVYFINKSLKNELIKKIGITNDDKFRIFRYVRPYHKMPYCFCFFDSFIFKFIYRLFCMFVSNYKMNKTN